MKITALQHDLIKHLNYLTYRKHRAIIILLPNENISGVAATFCLAVLKYNPPKGQFIFDILYSVAAASYFWNVIRRPPRTTYGQRMNTIVLPAMFTIIWKCEAMSLKINRTSWGKNTCKRLTTLRNKLLKVEILVHHREIQCQDKRKFKLWGVTSQSEIRSNISADPDNQKAKLVAV